MRNVLADIKCVIYSRFSSNMQRHESIEAQEYEMMNFAERNGITIVKSFQDEAKSGRGVEKRDGFLEMIEYCLDKKNGISMILCHKLDRFARDMSDYYKYKKILQNAGISIYFVENRLDTSERASIVSEAVLSSMSQLYSENLSAEVMKGLKTNARKCQHTGGTPPLGYDIDPKTKQLIINEYERDIVFLIFDLYGRFNMSYSQIIEELNKKEYKTKKGNEFSQSSLYEILHNEKYNGIYTYNKRTAKDLYGKRNNRKTKSDEDIIRIEDGCPKIIDDTLWELCQERLEKKKNDKSIREYQSKEQYLLKNKIYCECGRLMYGNRRRSGRNKRLYVTYACGGRRSKSECRNKEINKEYIEKFVLNQLVCFIFSKSNIQSLTDELNEYSEFINGLGKDEIRKKRNYIGRLKQKKRNIIEKIEEGINQAVFEDRLVELDNKIKLAKAEIDRLENEFAPEFEEEDVLNAKETFREEVFDNQYYAQKLIDTYLDRVVVKDEEVEVYLNVI